MNSAQVPFEGSVEHQRYRKSDHMKDASKDEMTNSTLVAESKIGL